MVDLEIGLMVLGEAEEAQQSQVLHQTLLMEVLEEADKLLQYLVSHLRHLMLVAAAVWDQVLAGLAAQAAVVKVMEPMALL